MFDGHQTLQVWKESVAGGGWLLKGRLGAAAPFNAQLIGTAQIRQ
jgi:hypothetical protein